MADISMEDDVTTYIDQIQLDSICHSIILSLLAIYSHMQ